MSCIEVIIAAASRGYDAMTADERKEGRWFKRSTRKKEQLSTVVGVDKHHVSEKRLRISHRENWYFLNFVLTFCKLNILVQHGIEAQLVFFYEYIEAQLIDWRIPVKQQQEASGTLLWVHRNRNLVY